MVVAAVAAVAAAVAEGAGAGAVGVAAGAPWMSQVYRYQWAGAAGADGEAVDAVGVVAALVHRCPIWQLYRLIYLRRGCPPQVRNAALPPVSSKH